MYREDKNLAILAHCTNEELGLLVDLICKGASSTEELSTSRVFERYFPNHKRYWKKIAEEIQRFGGNSVANIVRGSGVLYKNICFDVAKHLKIPCNKNDPIEDIEDAIMNRMLEKSLQLMTKAEQEIHIKQWRSKRKLSLTGGSHPGIALLLASILPGGFLTLSITGPAYRITIPAVILIASFRKRLLEEPHTPRLLE